ncbi:hypothetical protein C3F09_06515 [candidate division GN15 bacterium]|uniref:Uncharacterized protein n=1 Tax=candidate division GN15 bacterium TaxID=2072418 RepID=A0A855X639_9BACT|nr:MAG: hypothetical protein C3F09_06515 [candidate division GN15 bacterium]
MMLVRFRVAGKLVLPEPPSAWVDLAHQIAAHQSVAASLRTALARLVFDSWALPEPVGVRGGAAIEQRRVRFESSPVTVDLRAEHLKSGWAFVAQVTGVEHGQARLNADRKVLALDEHGICQWSDPKPPKKLTVVTSTHSVELPELTWRTKPPRKPRDDS